MLIINIRFHSWFRPSWKSLKVIKIWLFIRIFRKPKQLFWSKFITFIHSSLPDGLHCSDSYWNFTRFKFIKQVEQDFAVSVCLNCPWTILVSEAKHRKDPKSLKFRQPNFTHKLINLAFSIILSPSPTWKIHDIRLMIPNFINSLQYLNIIGINPSIIRLNTGRNITIPTTDYTFYHGWGHSCTAW